MDTLYRRLNSFWSFGPRYTLWRLRKVVFGWELRKRVPGAPEVLSKFTGVGLEIGGPSQFFQPGREFPIYSVAHNIDNVNYSDTTFWEGTLQEGRNFLYNANKAPGYQFICEASDLSAISDCTYDFVASCHTLEHCANPIRSLNEWRRVLKSDGWFALVLPHREGTFDHRRRVTEFEHLLEDYRRGVDEDDTTHFAEILASHDLARDPAHKSRQSFEKWISENTVTRGAHHHVFDPALAITLVDYAGFEVVSTEALMPFHIFIVAQKSSRRREEREKIGLQTLRACCERSPFKSDRKRNLSESVG